jgi:phosphoglycerol transferase MdoB-like AlkP superfamily enzyme
VPLLQRVAAKIGKWVVSYLDVALFVLVFMLNMYLFAKYTGSVLWKEGAVGFTKALFKFLFAGGPRGPIVRDIAMVSLGTGILLASWTLLFKRSTRMIVLMVMNLLVLLIVIADLIYFRFFEDLLSIVVFTQIGQLGDVNSSIRALFRSTDWIFLLEAAITTALGIYFYRRLRSGGNRQTWRSEKRPTWRIWSGRLVMFVITASVGVWTVWYPLYIMDKYGGKDFFQKAVSAETIYKRTGLIGFHVFDAYRTVSGLFHDYTVSADSYASYNRWFREHDPGIMADTPYRGIAKGMNVLVVQVEALQNFVIHRSVEGQEITPNLNRLAEESLYFDHFYHQTAQGRTVDAEFAVNTSLQPLSAGSVFVRFPKHYYEALPSILAQNGYDTAAFHAFRAGFWNRNMMYRNIGYNRFYSQNDFAYDESTDRIGWGLNDISFLKQTAQYLSSSVQQPFYAFAVTLTSHHPYYFKNEDKTLRLNSFKDELFKNYLHTIHFMDQAIGELIHGLKTSGLWDNTVLIIYGDHDNGLVTSSAEMHEFTGGYPDTLEFEQLKRSVPLIIRVPGGELTGTRSEMAGMTDVAPTLLHLLGIEMNETHMTGSNLLIDGERFVPFRDGSVTDGEHWFADGGDGTLDGGRCYRVSDSSLTDVSACAGMKERANQLLQMTEDIILGDLLRKFVAEKS